MKKTVAILDASNGKVMIDQVEVNPDNPDWGMEDYVRDKYGSYIDWMEVEDNTIHVHKEITLVVKKF